MGIRTQNAINLCLDGIRDGNAREAIQRYAGARYTQHSTGVPDGPEGFVAFFEGFLKRNPVRDIEIVRSIEDGRYVFVHVYQSLNHGEARWVTMDMFDTDAAGKIIEHWDVIAAYQADSVSGHTMLDGPTEITDLEQTETNKAHVRMFLVDVLQNRRYDRLARYVSTESYDQHNPNLANGIDAYAAYLTSKQPTVDFVFNVIGQGNFVASYSRVVVDAKELAVFDLFRLENGLLVEHWDTIEEIMPRSTWINCGKF